MINTIACIPAKNEEKTLAAVIVDALPHVTNMVVCDDGSTDHTEKIAQALGVFVCKHKVNRGYGAALQTAISKALELKAEIIITLDADGQHDPEDIPKVVQPILDGEADIVIGSRFLSSVDETPEYRKTGIKVLGKLAGAEVSDSQSGFRAYRAEVLRGLSFTESGMGLSEEILMKAKEKGFRVVEVPITIRFEGLDTSEQHPLLHGADVAGAILRTIVERRPLTYFGIPALFFVCVGLYFLAQTLELYLTRHVFITSTALVAFFSFTFGLILFFTATTLYALSRIRRE